ncbi:50S ribosomal protein L5 [Candidatus Woesearchaeota archaeon]|nr:50S ribosomal protein L5 [Candidatus Woesearchaeota archaeon]
MNKMRDIRIEKLTLNFGAGKEQSHLAKGMKLLEHITGKPPVKTITSKRIAQWGLRKGLPIGCKITLRNGQATELIQKLLAAKDNKLNPSCFDEYGNISFGIHEYIDIPGIKYDPEIGIIGLQASITLERPGFRIKRRKILKRRIHKNHGISKIEAYDFFKKQFNIKIGDE